MSRFDGLKETTVAVCDAAEILAMTLAKLESADEITEAMETLRKLGQPPLNGMAEETGGPGSCDDGALFRGIAEFLLVYRNPFDI